MALKYKSKFTGEQIDNSVELIQSNTATDGQVLTANGTGGAIWQDATGGGTEVVANPVLAGTESDLTGLEVAGTKYKVPTGGGTEVVANPVLAGTESDLTGLEVAGTKYKVPSGGSGGGTQLYSHSVSVGEDTYFLIVTDSRASTAFTSMTDIYNNMKYILSIIYDDGMAQSSILFSGTKFFRMEGTGDILRYSNITFNGDAVTPL